MSRTASQNQFAHRSVVDNYLNWGKLSVLAFAGAVATLLVAFAPLPIRIPGHVILKAALPQMLGMALVWHPLSGTIGATGSLLTAALLLATGLGHLPAAAMVALATFGPALDYAKTTSPQGWRRFAKFAVAGAAVNMLAFLVRGGTAFFQNDLLHTHGFHELAGLPLLSFVLCGLAAGIIGACLLCVPQRQRQE